MKIRRPREISKIVKSQGEVGRIDFSGEMLFCSLATKAEMNLSINDLCPLLPSSNEVEMKIRRGKGREEISKIVKSQGERED